LTVREDNFLIFMNISSPISANGRVYANSAYGLYFHIPVNVLLVFAAKYQRTTIEER